MPTDTDLVAGTRVATAFFDTRDAAEKARTDLVSAGFKPDAITLAGQQSSVDAKAEEAISYDEGGFWHALKEFFMPDEDRYSYAEGLRRGGFALSVRADEAEYDRALDILDADGAVDIDERAEGWRSEGWSGYVPGMDATAGAMPFGPVGAGTAGFGASMAGEDGYQSHTLPRAEAVDRLETPTRDESLTARGDAESEIHADPGRIGTGADEPGLLNPDMRERIGSGTASMTPPTPTGPQDGAVTDNAASFDRGLSSKAAAEDASLGAPTRSGVEQASTPSTVGTSVASPSWTPRRDETVQRPRVRGFILDPSDGRDPTSGAA